MTLLLIPALWILALVIVSGLCLAARLGDVEQPGQSLDCPGLDALGGQAGPEASTERAGHTVAASRRLAA